MYEVGNYTFSQRITPYSPQQEIMIVARLARKIHLCR